MARASGMRMLLHYDDDGFWRVKSNLDKSINESSAQTADANLDRPYGAHCAWKVKVNLCDEPGMEPAPDLQVIALDEKEAIFRQASKSTHFDLSLFVRWRHVSHTTRCVQL